MFKLSASFSLQKTRRVDGMAVTARTVEKCLASSWYSSPTCSQLGEVLLFSQMERHMGPAKSLGALPYRNKGIITQLLSGRLFQQTVQLSCSLSLKR